MRWTKDCSSFRLVSNEIDPYRIAMPRLFTGLEIPAPQRNQLALLQSGLPGARWVEPSDMHITLRFIGDVTTKLATDIIEALSSRNWPQCEIRLGELASFGGNKPSTVYASVQHIEELDRLHSAQETLMQRLGLPADSRKFTPHVTLARGRLMKPLDVARYLSERGFFVAPPFVPDRFVLYSARESVGGGPYVIEEAFSMIAKPQEKTDTEQLLG